MENPWIKYFAIPILSFDNFKSLSQSIPFSWLKKLVDYYLSYNKEVFDQENPRQCKIIFFLS